MNSRRHFSLSFEHHISVPFSFTLRYPSGGLLRLLRPSPHRKLWEEPHQLIGFDSKCFPTVPFPTILTAMRNVAFFGIDLLVGLHRPLYHLRLCLAPFKGESRLAFLVLQAPSWRPGHLFNAFGPFLCVFIKTLLDMEEVVGWTDGKE